MLFVSIQVFHLHHKPDLLMTSLHPIHISPLLVVDPRRRSLEASYAPIDQRLDDLNQCYSCHRASH